MTTAARVAVIAALCGAALGQQEKQAQEQEPPFHLPETVELKPDIVYARYGAREMHVDLYLPKQSAGLRPAVVYIHGGGWRGGNKRAFSRHAAHMATLGFAGAAIEYRLSGEAKYPAAIHDSKAAVRWLRAHAAEYRIDPNRIGAAGGSAGGHLVGLLGTTNQIKEFEGAGGNSNFSSQVRAVAAFNPAVDFVSFGKGASGNASNAVYEFLGATYAHQPNLWAQAAPITHVNQNSAVFLFLHGTGDTVVPYQQSVDMMNKLKTAGIRAEIFSAPEAGHGFFNRPPWFQPALKRMEEFFIRELK
jgi:acetyl esterase/lipase